jgi:hypothetical protein
MESLRILPPRRYLKRPWHMVYHRALARHRYLRKIAYVFALVVFLKATKLNKEGNDEPLPLIRVTEPINIPLTY